MVHSICLTRFAAHLSFRATSTRLAEGSPRWRNPSARWPTASPRRYGRDKLRYVPYGTWLRLASLFCSRKKVTKKRSERCFTPPLPTVRFTLAHNSPRVYNAPLKQWARPLLKQRDRSSSLWPVASLSIGSVHQLVNRAFGRRP